MTPNLVLDIIIIVMILFISKLIIWMVWPKKHQLAVEEKASSLPEHVKVCPECGNFYAYGTSFCSTDCEKRSEQLVSTIRLKEACTQSICLECGDTFTKRVPSVCSNQCEDDFIAKQADIE